MKEKLGGRASGGLITLIKKNLKYEIIHTSYLWVFLKVRVENMYFTIGSIYVKPNYDMEQALLLLEDVLLPLCTQDGQKIILGGDFNGRIADNNFVDENLAEELGLISQRISMDQTVNKREVLLEYMESRGFLVLNGRTEGDAPGQFTYNSNVGKSVVDLLWCNPEFCRLVESLHVSEYLLSSDHLPITIGLHLTLPSLSTTNKLVQITKCKWCEEKKDYFSEKINTNSEAQINYLHFYEDFKRKIQETAKDLNLIERSTYTPGLLKRKSKQPWYNRKCRKLKTSYQNKFRKWKRSNNDKDLKSFLSLKQQYHKTCSKLKRTHEKLIKDKLYCEK